jgi:hypothetical protein
LRPTWAATAALTRSFAAGGEGYQRIHAAEDITHYEQAIPI